MSGLSKFITNFSLFFTEKFRITILLIIGIVGLGLASYLSLLPREGFPEISFPIGTMNVVYSANDVSAVDQDVTIPIEKALSDISEINEVQSITNPNFVTFVFTFDSDQTSESGIEIIQNEIESKVELPELAQVTYTAINATSFDGENDFIFSISSPDKNLQELNDLANEIADELSGLDEVIDASAEEYITESQNPFTGEVISETVNFTRTGLRVDDGDLRFENAQQIGLIKSDDADAFEISNAVKDKIEELREDNLVSDDVSFQYYGDISESVATDIQSLESNALGAIIVIAIVLFLFVNWRAAIITVVFLPIVMLASFLALYLFGQTINVISLFGLILVLGLLVDDAIVIVEAIEYQRKRGLRRLEAVQEAIRRVGVADLSGTVTTLIVFVPMLFISGVLGEFIRLIPLTVIIALVISLLIALTVTTMFSRAFLASPTEKKNILYYILNGFSELISKLGNFVSRFVNFYLESKLKFVGAFVLTLIVLGLSFALPVIIIFNGQVNFSIFPQPKDATEIQMSISNNSEELAITDTEEASNSVDDVLLDSDISRYIDAVHYTSTSKSGAGLLVELTPIDERDQTAPEIVDLINDKISDKDSEFGENIEVTATVVSQGPPTSDFPFGLQIYSADQELLESSVNEVRDYLTDRTFTPNENVEDRKITIDQVEVEYLDTIVRVDGERLVQINIGFVEDDINSGDINGLISQLDEYYSSDKLSELGLEGATFEYDQGQESDFADSFISAGVVLVVALIVMYMILVAQFDSLLQPLIILTALPFSLLGIFPGLALTNNDLSFFVMIGMIALAGIAVNNSIILIDYANQERSMGKGLRSAIVEAVKVRFRPLLTTTVTTVVGLLPLAISDPFWEGLSFTIIFGLIASTLMVILFLPVIYITVEKVRQLNSYIFNKVTNFFGIKP